MKKCTAFFIILFCLLSNLSFAQNIIVTIRFFDQKIYFVNDPIDIKLTIKNDSASPYHFRIADNRVFSINFDVRTATNKPGNYYSEYYQNERNSLKPVLYREVVLAPGEEYSTVIRFSDYVSIKEPGLYFIQALFYPDLYLVENANSLLSNKLSLNLRPAVASNEERSFIEAQIDKALQRQDLPPDEIINYLLRARMKNEWSRFFLYLNLEQLYLNSYLKNPAAQNQFQKLSEEEKKIKIEWYKKQIMEGKEEWHLVMLPHNFEMVETSYTPTEARVKVKQIYRHPTYDEIRYYTYYLKRSNNTWEVVNYIVQNVNVGSLK